MKIQMGYDEFKKICLDIAEKIKDENYTEIVAVSRGGISASHIISKKLNLPVGYYIPSARICVLNNKKDDNTKICIIEDLVAQGRTYDLIQEDFKDFNYDFIPILIDGKYNKNTFKYYGLYSNDWIVFPYEDFESMEENDRGLFRDGTDSYGKNKENK